MANVAIQRLTKRFEGGVVAVDGIDLQIADGELVTLLGPSGCGKTTTLRMIAGLEDPDGGVIRFDDRVIAAPDDSILLPPEQRGVGMVFQSYAIWPHMTVFGNVAYPLRVQNVKRGDIRPRVEDALRSVGLLELKDRLATKLSGGQQQRVAIARAIVARPGLLLLDEPLSNLDARLRSQMRSEIRRLQQRLAITSVYVTHDQVEAMVLSDRIVVMQDGRIQQVGTPREIYSQPINRFVAEFVGFDNFLTGTVVEATGDAVAVRLLPAGPVLVCAQARPVDAGSEVLVAVRSSQLSLSSTGGEAAGSPREDGLAGVIAEAIYFGEATEYRIESGPITLVATLNDRDALRLHGTLPSVGDAVTVQVPPATAVLLAG